MSLSCEWVGGIFGQYTNYSRYQLADFVECYPERTKRKHKRPPIKKCRGNDFGYPGSIADRYWKAAREPRSIETLARVVRSYRREAHNHTVLHLRVGDVTEGVSAQTLLHEEHNFFYSPRNALVGIDDFDGQWNQYVRPLSAFTTALAGRLQRGAPITVMIGAHWGQQTHIDGRNTCAYVSGVLQHLRRLGFQPTLRLLHEPDDDFLFATSARAVVTTGGGYSRLIADVARHMGHMVVSV